MNKELEALARAYQEVTEKLVGGQKELDQDKDGDIDKHDFAKLRAKKKKNGEDDPKGEKGETATMNPKVDGSKSEQKESVKSADKKPEEYVGPDGKTRVRMVPVNREIVKKESTEMSIRDKLLSVLEKKDHGNTDQKQAYDDNWSPSAKKMAADHKPEVKADGAKAAEDDARAIEKSAKAAPKNSTDKGAKGDMKIINAPEDITKKAGMKTESTINEDNTKESFSKTVKSIAEAYQSMYEKYTHEVDHVGDHSDVKDFIGKAKSAGLKAKLHTMHGPGAGNAVIHLGHDDEGKVHDFLKKHYSSDHTMDDTKAARIGHNESTNLDEDYGAMRDAQAHAAKDGKNYKGDVSVQHKYDAYHMKKRGYTHFEPGSYGTRRYTKGSTGMNSTKIEPKHYSGISGV